MRTWIVGRDMGGDMGSDMGSGTDMGRDMGTGCLTNGNCRQGFTPAWLTFPPDSFRHTHVLGDAFIPLFSSRKLGDMYWVKIYTSVDKKRKIDIGLHLLILAAFYVAIHVLNSF